MNHDWEELGALIVPRELVTVDLGEDEFLRLRARLEEMVRYAACLSDMDLAGEEPVVQFTREGRP